MRFALGILFALAPIAFAAPVPKECRRPSLSGHWEVVGARYHGAENPMHYGERWIYSPDGFFAKPSTPTEPSGRFAPVPGGADIWFDREEQPWHILTEFDEDTVKLAFPNDRTVRATDFGSETNLVVWTMKRLKE